MCATGILGLAGCTGASCPPTGYEDGYRAGQELALSPGGSAQLFQAMQAGYYPAAYYRYWNGQPFTPEDWEDYASVLAGEYTGIDFESEPPPGCWAYEQAYPRGFFDAMNAFGQTSSLDDGGPNDPTAVEGDGPDVDSGGSVSESSSCAGVECGECECIDGECVRVSNAGLLEVCPPLAGGDSHDGDAGPAP
jgi:hypothetical protein